MKSVGDNPTHREVILDTDDTDFRLIRNRRDGPAYLAVRRESDCQSDLLLIALLLTLAGNSDKLYFYQPFGRENPMTREDILEAAAQVFRQKGFHGASMQDIAEAVNLQKASLYHHVASKQEILLDLLDRALELLLERISAINNQNIPANEKLKQMISAYLQILAENTDLSAVLLFEHRSLERKQHARHVPNRDKFETLWRNVLEEGVSAKLFKCDNPALTARAILGILNWTITWYHPTGPLEIDEIADHYSNLLLNGLLKK
jgi:AcrR family transcriptional regulator